MKDVHITQLQRHVDDRGSLAEMFRIDEMAVRPSMGYLSWTHTGQGRGPHMHYEQTDIFVFAGPGTLRLYLWDKRQHSETHGEAIQLDVGENNPCKVMIPPGVVHGYRNTGDHSALVLNFPDHLFKGWERSEPADEARFENRPHCGFQMG